MQIDLIHKTCTVIFVGVEIGSPTLVHVFNGSSGVSAITLLKDLLFVTRQGVAQVSVYNTTSFQLQSQITFSGLGDWLYGLAACTSHNYLYISDFYNYNIHRVDLSIAGDSASITWNVSCQPWALSLSSSSNVLVACTKVNQVKEYTPNGSLVREITHSDHLRQAVELSSGILAVSQQGQVHGVFKLSTSCAGCKNGYGDQPGSGTGQMNSPRGLIVDEHGYVLVADRDNHRILVLNPSLTDARQFPLPVDAALRYPYSLALDRSRGRMYIGEHGGQNRLLVIENVKNVVLRCNTVWASAYNY